ncbi:MAG: hypothetical protein DYH13_10195 [Alphaproteobacteria bacterium PRO2]|nr:hypothetical protein [Alphaproteobacteria bacterium PRO2]
MKRPDDFYCHSRPHPAIVCIMTNKFDEITGFLDPRRDFDRACIEPSEKEFLRKFANGKFEARVNEADLGLAVMRGFYRGGSVGLLLGSFYDAASGHPGSASALGAVLGIVLDSGQILVRHTMREPAREKAAINSQNDQI